MKKLFICVMTSLCSTFAFADADLVVKPAAIYGSSGTMEIVINKANTTAFQFDVKLPTGISVSAFETASGDRKFEKNLVDATTNKWRFLSYDEKNATFDAGTTFNITLAAAADAKEGEAETETILLVDPNGNGTTVDGSTSNISLGAKITIPAGQKLAMVSARALDFTSLETKGVKAYICTGNEKDGAVNKFWLSRVKTIPANTPILVKGPAGDYDVPGGDGSIYYPDNFLQGNATGKSTIEWDGFQNFAVILNDGSIKALPTTVTSFDEGKAYFHVPATIASNVAGSSQEIAIPKGLKLAAVYDYDLDFTDVEGLKAYSVSGYGKDHSIILSRVKKASAGTPLMLRGTTKKTYTVPSSAANVAYKNMLAGNTSDEPAILNPTMGDMTILVVILESGKIVKLGAENASFAKGKAWLPVPTSYYESGIASARGISNGFIEEETEVICLEAAGQGGENDVKTGIHSINEIQSDDAWYNLSGQRIDTPTKKGLYIKNGQKVIVR